MKVGDLVRFAKWGEFNHLGDWAKVEKPHIGILIEHDKLMGFARILSEEEIFKVRAQLVEKAGKRDIESR